MPVGLTADEIQLIQQRLDLVVCPSPQDRVTYAVGIFVLPRVRVLACPAYDDPV
jgi:hypothetical protein